MPNQDISSWQVVLQTIIQFPKERQRLAAALGINTITLSRWAKNESQPQRAYLTRLVKVVQPHQRAELLNALLLAYPEMQEKLMEETAEFVPASFYRQILRDRAAIIEALRPWQISGMVIDAAMGLLDPHELGMAITPVLCMPPVGGKIRSLRERGGRGTEPWTADQEQKSIFLGMNSLAGYVVQSGRAKSVGNVQEEKYIPVFAYPEDQEISAAACPIWLEGKIAGCLLAVSIQPEHFTQARMDLLINFTNVFSLALNPGDFYDHRMVQLRYIPHPRHQHASLRTFRPRVIELMTHSGQNGHSLSNAEAEKRIWQALEDELLEIGENLDEDRTWDGESE